MAIVSKLTECLQQPARTAVVAVDLLGQFDQRWLAGVEIIPGEVSNRFVVDRVLVFLVELFPPSKQLRENPRI